MGCANALTGLLVRTLFMNIISSFGWQLTFHLPLHVLLNTAAGVIDLSNLSIARGPMYEDVKKYLVMTGHPETSTMGSALRYLS